MSNITRRGCITLLGGAAAAWPLAARAQQPAMPVIGYLRSTTAGPAAPLLVALRKGLAEAGFTDGENVAIDERYADDDRSGLPALARQLVQRKVAVIVTHQFSAPAAMAATQIIPIVFVSGADPVRAALVQSLNRPGGNVTGISFFTSPLIAKRMELLSELVPKPAVIAVLLDPNWAESAFEVREVQEAARTLGREILMLRARSVLDLDAVLGTMAQARPGALLVGSGGFLNASQRRKLVAFTAREGIAAISSLRQFVEAGGLMSYGNSQTDAYRQAGLYVGRILKGEKPGELPVMRATKFELVINLRTAKALGMQIPPTLLARADEVIE